MRLLFILLLFCLPCISYADGMPDEEKQQDEVCKVASKKHENISKNHAEYLAGVDVHGRDVVPADLNGVNTYPPVVIPITLNLAQKFGLNLPSGVELKPEVGQIEIFQDGRIRFNGDDILEKIQEHCESRAKEIKPDGQEPPHDIGSADTIGGEYPENTPHKKN